MFKKLRILRSISIFNGALPISAQHIKLVADLFTSRIHLQNCKLVCSVDSVSHGSKLTVSYTPQISAPYIRIRDSQAWWMDF